MQHVHAHQPVRYTLAVLLAARSGEQVTFKRSVGSTETPVLIPELVDALKRFGRELMCGEEGVIVNQGELPQRRAGDG